jgi:hypothetical protein
LCECLSRQWPGDAVRVAVAVVTAQSINYVTKWNSALDSLRMDNVLLNNPEFKRLGSHAYQTDRYIHTKNLEHVRIPKVRGNRTLSRDKIHLDFRRTENIFNLPICRSRMMYETFRKKNSYNFNSEDGCRLSRNSSILPPPPPK